MFRTCVICGKLFPVIKNGGNKRKCCFECLPTGLTLNEKTVLKRRAAKHLAVQTLGGRCEKCGESREHLLAFHHVNPETKKGTPSTLLARSLEDFFVECQKCILLCHNCHADFHYLHDNNSITLESYLGKDVPKYEDTIVHKSQVFLDDSVNIDLLSDINKSFLLENQKKKKKKKNEQKIIQHTKLKEIKTDIIPTKNELYQALIKNHGNFMQTGRQFNVTDGAIRKWCKKYDLPIHSGGYDPLKGEGGSKPVAMLDKNTDEELQRFKSLAEAARFLKKEKGAISIGRAAKGLTKTAYGYKWKFVGDIDTLY